MFVALDPPHWTLDPNKLMQSVTGRTKAIVLNRLVNSMKGGYKMEFLLELVLALKSVLPKVRVFIF